MNILAQWLTSILLLFPVACLAEPIAVASSSGVTVTLHNDPCLLEAVSNLPLRATWKEGPNGYAYEGCWGASGEIVMLYFSDRTVVGAPAGAFQRINGV